MARETNSNEPPRTKSFDRTVEGYKHFSWSISMPSSRLANHTSSFISLASSSCHFSYPDADGLDWNERTHRTMNHVNHFLI